ncbi:Periplasmic thiol:disulfide oxidoreductase DsbB, required for DsbA reoxidation [Rhodovastum atsumiense]|uniref:Disulfide bond formation protein B n=1 Tax=Rhodovastum atsumiense TaxID=504468 RepID=A0A5M6IL89_9PROT|nr:disulfide bond formation protein B [Rhodovastum atsumiense]KAA5609036.1 disulfide bond formation protein B [Rhodovastum atsumiense]CAH2604674.1 Periplasmic thiol:disulfide oxidoreductase DsbB, required for DsbA reoxidation [Rhodovastum atsumiense]
MTLTIPPLRAALALSALVAAVALGVAFAAEIFAGLVPCALCLLERWPYRIALGIGLIGVLLPPRWARAALALLGVVVFAGALIAAVHLGVEARWWPSPLPECAAPRLTHGSIADQLAALPERPAKPCDEPTYLIPGLPLSTAALNLIVALAFSGGIATFLLRSRRSAA